MWSGHVLDLCGSPTHTLEPSGGIVRRIWNLVVPVDTSERLTPFASVHESLKIFPETMQIFVAICFIHHVDVSPQEPFRHDILQVP